MQIRLAPALARAEPLAVPRRSQLRTKAEVRGGAFLAFKGISAALAAFTAASAIVADAMIFMMAPPADLRGQVMKTPDDVAEEERDRVE
jgi:hypothetical protein